ncbi:hypothetical protein B0T22DRAFT_379341, partial [Podospora appendiculata]
QVPDAPEGYPMLARHMSSAGEFYIAREFRYLQSRVLLHQQDELRDLEAQLHRMDEHDSAIRPDILRSRDLDEMVGGHRKQLITTIRERLKEYGDFLLVSNQLASMDRPSHFDIQGLQNFFHHHAPLVRHEVYTSARSDFVSFKAGRDESWLDRVILRLLVKFDSNPLRVCSLRCPTRLSFVIRITAQYQIFSHTRIHVLKMVILILLMLSLLCVPLYPLFIWTQGTVDGPVLAKIMGLMVSCTFLFGLVLSVCTRARKHEIFGTCAAYMAVLIVFMSQGAGNAKS